MPCVNVSVLVYSRRLFLNFVLGTAKPENSLVTLQFIVTGLLVTCLFLVHGCCFIIHEFRVEGKIEKLL